MSTTVNNVNETAKATDAMNKENKKIERATAIYNAIIEGLENNAKLAEMIPAPFPKGNAYVVQYTNVVTSNKVADRIQLHVLSNSVQVYIGFNVVEREKDIERLVNSEYLKSHNVVNPWNSKEYCYKFKDVTDLLLLATYINNNLFKHVTSDIDILTGYKVENVTKPKKTPKKTERKTERKTENKAQ